MKIIEPSVSIYREPDHLRKIETIARVCTGTQDKVGTKPEFVENLWKRHHETPFEHCRVAVPYKKYMELEHDYFFGAICTPYGFSDRTKSFKRLYDSYTVINARDFLTIGGTLEELKELPEADDYMTVKFVCDIGIERELLRHRQMSFMARSTRYCNMKDEIEFVRPVPFEWSSEQMNVWQDMCVIAETQYKLMTEYGCHPQEARTVLPLSTATVLYVSGRINQWQDVLRLRLDKAAHPQMRYLMQMLVNLPDCPEELKMFAMEITGKNVEND